MQEKMQNVEMEFRFKNSSIVPISAYISTLGREITHAENFPDSEK